MDIEDVKNVYDYDILAITRSMAKSNKSTKRIYVGKNRPNIQLATNSEENTVCSLQWSAKNQLKP